MKTSIKRRMLVGFVALLFMMLGILIIINCAFFERYNISSKQKEFLKVYRELLSGAENELFDGWVMGQDKMEERSQIDSKLNHLAERNNLMILVINNRMDTVYTNAYDSDILKKQLSAFVYNQDTGSVKILEETDQYMIERAELKRSGKEYLIMWGRLTNDHIFMVQSPIDNILENVIISNKFFGYAGMVVLMIGIVFVWLFAKQMTEPIQELTVLSKRMADMDFEAKYTGGGRDEIGMLGANFNKMSERLETTICELKKANVELQRDIEHKEKQEAMRVEFISNVSHELKTPIALIQGYAEGLKEGVNDDPENREFYCDVIMDEAYKMNRLVKNLLTLNQLEYGNDDSEFVRFDLVEVIKGVLQSSSILLQQKEAKLIFEEMGPVYVWADEFKVEQVVRNYLSNALNHLNEEKVIQIKVESREDKVHVTVFNTGDPIPEEDRDRIWDKFYKVDKARTREYGGNGVGLSIVKAIMESFHEKYGVENYDNGVAFWFELDKR